MGSYQPDHELVIDPGLEYSTFLGGASMERAENMAVDSNGNVVVAGVTQSMDFPTPIGAVSRTFNGGSMDAFVAKLNADGSGLVYATYLGGTPTPTRRGNTDQSELVRAVAVDDNGNAYVTGQTGSGDFPTTSGAFQTSLKIGEQQATDAFVAKLGPTGSLAYSTFLGGAAGMDDGRAIAVDASGNAYIAGSTFSADFPTTSSAFDTTQAGGEDVFVVKLNGTGSSLVCSTLLGGADNDLSHGLAIDAAGNAYVSDSTRSVNSPSTAGAFQPTHSGGEFAELFEAFVTKVSSNGSTLIYSTFLGGTEIDHGGELAVDSGGNAYVIVATQSSTFPTTLGAYDTVFDGSNEGVIVKLNATGSDLVYSTFFRGASAIRLDADYNAWLGGGASSGAPTTADAFQPTNNGGGDGYIAQLDAAGSRLLYASFFGGSNSDGISEIDLGSGGEVYVAGTTQSADFPTTAGAFDRTFSGDPSIFWGDVFVANFVSGATTPPPADTTAPTVSISSPTTGSAVSGTVSVAVSVMDDVGVTEVRFFVDGTQIGVDTSAPYGVSWDTTATTNGSRTLTATAHAASGNTGSAAPVTVTVDNTTPAPVLSSLQLNPTSVPGGDSSAGTVTLTAVAPAGGATVALSSSNTAAATVPASVTVPAGSTSATFTISTSSVSSNTSSTISASYGGVTRTATLTVNAPAATDTVSISRAEYDGGKRVLRVEASSSSSSATLKVYLTATDESIGTLSGGKGEFSWPTNPQSITVRSSLGGAATRTVTVK